MSDLPPPTRPKRPDPLHGERESERLAPGGFFAQQKALADAKRHHLDRLGMDARQVAALRMPDLVDPIMPVEGAPAIQMIDAPAALAPQAPATDDDALPLTAYSPKRPPRVHGVRGDLPEE